MTTKTTGTESGIDYGKTKIELPDLIRGGRNPWAGTVDELIEATGDREMSSMIERAAALGLYAEDDETGEDNLHDILPQLLATDTEALQRFTDDPNAKAVL